MKNSEVLLKDINKMIRIEDATDEETKYVQRKYKYNYNIIDVEARKAFL